ncbi:protein FMC1 homolog [Xenia sp. Carnegie-2017]|uniref:protein FMC1 homolog n=1 Tax=Xenia sp. Carnegie-2017 TaxID=2897299 RepID=UPI001F0411E9|nr:protein FMC1 homolog [Xenia sp. Carnegie-2017]
MASKKKSIYLYKEILYALRQTAGQVNISMYRNKYGYSYVKSLCVNKDLHKNEDSGESLQYLGETYLCLLRSIEGAKLLHEKYKGGENSVEKTASKVGLKLPPELN